MERVYSYNPGTRTGQVLLERWHMGYGRNIRFWWKSDHIMLGLGLTLGGATHTHVVHGRICVAGI